MEYSFQHPAFSFHALTPALMGGPASFQPAPSAFVDQGYSAVRAAAQEGLESCVWMYGVPDPVSKDQLYWLACIQGQHCQGMDSLSVYRAPPDGESQHPGFAIFTFSTRAGALHAYQNIVHNKQYTDLWWQPTSVQVKERTDRLSPLEQSRLLQTYAKMDLCHSQRGPRVRCLSDSEDEGTVGEMIPHQHSAPAQPVSRPHSAASSKGTQPLAAKSSQSVAPTQALIAAAPVPERAKPAPAQSEPARQLVPAVQEPAKMPSNQTPASAKDASAALPHRTTSTQPVDGKVSVLPKVAARSAAFTSETSSTSAAKPLPGTTLPKAGGQSTASPGKPSTQSGDKAGALMPRAGKAALHQARKPAEKVEAGKSSAGIKQLPKGPVRLPPPRTISTTLLSDCSTAPLSDGSIGPRLGKPTSKQANLPSSSVALKAKTTTPKLTEGRPLKRPRHDAAPKDKLASKLPTKGLDNPDKQPPSPTRQAAVASTANNAASKGNATKTRAPEAPGDRKVPAPSTKPSQQRKKTKPQQTSSRTHHSRPESAHRQHRASSSSRRESRPSSSGRDPVGGRSNPPPHRSLAPLLDQTWYPARPAEQHVLSPGWGHGRAHGTEELSPPHRFPSPLDSRPPWLPPPRAASLWEDRHVPPPRPQYPFSPGRGLGHHRASYPMDDRRREWETDRMPLHQSLSAPHDCDLDRGRRRDDEWLIPAPDLYPKAGVYDESECRQRFSDRPSPPNWLEHRPDVGAYPEAEYGIRNASPGVVAFDRWEMPGRAEPDGADFRSLHHHHDGPPEADGWRRGREATPPFIDDHMPPRLGSMDERRPGLLSEFGEFRQCPPERGRPGRWVHVEGWPQEEFREEPRGPYF